MPIRVGTRKRKHPEGLEPRDPKRRQPQGTHEWTQWFNGRIREWKTSLGLGSRDRAPRQEYKVQAAALREEWAKGDPRAPLVPPQHGEGELSGMSYEDRIGETLWRISSSEFPVCPRLFYAVVRELSDPDGRKHAEGPGSALTTCGLTSRMEQARRDFRRQSYVNDSGLCVFS